MSDALGIGARRAPINPPRPADSHSEIPIASRIQRPRSKGTPLPEGAVFVGRHTLWGNPFARRQWGHAKGVILHERWLTGRLGALSLERLDFSAGEIAALDRRRCRVLTRLHELAGHDLACWCPLASPWCHAEILLRLAPIHADYHRHAH